MSRRWIAPFAAAALVAATAIGTVPEPAAAATSQTLTPSADAGVYSGAPSTNYGASTTARLDHSATADRPWYLRFAAPAVPAGQHITGAHLRFTTLGLPAGYTTGPAVSVVDTSTTWGESTITYANRPAAGTKVSGSAPAAAVGGVTDVALKGYAGGQVSLLVRATNAGSAYIYEREDTRGHPPTLVVTTAPNAVQPNLAPATGAWLGWYQSGNADPRTRETAYARKADAFRRYYSMSQMGSWPSPGDVTVAQADSGRRILFASVTNKCYGACPTTMPNGQAIPAPGITVKNGNPDFDGQYYTPAQISSGALDMVIDAQAARIKASGIRFVLQFMPEVDTLTNTMDDVTTKPEYGGMTLRDWWETTYPAAFRHWRDRLKADGVTNAVYAVGYAGFRSDATAYTRTYPGDSYVDWIAWDPYDFACTKGGVDPTWRAFYSRLEAGLLGAGARSKSYALFETGVGARAKSTCRVSWVKGMAEAAAALPKIKAVLYFDRTNADYDLETDPAVLSAWVSEIASPYFNQPHSG
jgi:hypothetical protein